MGESFNSLPDYVRTNRRHGLAIKYLGMNRKLASQVTGIELVRLSEYLDGGSIKLSKWELLHLQNLVVMADIFKQARNGGDIDINKVYMTGPSIYFGKKSNMEYMVENPGRGIVVVNGLLERQLS